VSLPLDRQCEYVGLPVPTPELRFAPPRRWRFDFAFEPQKVAVEIEGGAFSRGRHTRGVGFVNDLEKYNHAVALGWKVLRVTPSQVKDGTALGFIENVLKVTP
jgi:very-short-patch-repair endonuclease